MCVCKHMCDGQNMIYDLWSSIPQWDHGYINLIIGLMTSKLGRHVLGCASHLVCGL